MRKLALECLSEPDAIPETNNNYDSGAENLEGTIVTYTCNTTDEVTVNSTCDSTGNWTVVALDCPACK